MMVTFLSCIIETDWSNDGIQLVYLGPMMGIDRVQPQHLSWMDWAQNQSRIESKLITLIRQRSKRYYKFPPIFKQIFN